MKSKNRDESVKHLNKVLQHGSEREFFKALFDPNLGIFNLIDEFAIPLYFEEMKIDRSESETDIGYSDIIASIKILSIIANITKAIETNNPELIYSALCCPDAYVANLKEENKIKYCRALIAVHCEKQALGEQCPILTYFDIQECIDIVNNQYAESNTIGNLLKKLNNAVKKINRLETMETLQQILLSLMKTISPDDASLYLRLLQRRLKEKRKDGCELDLEDVVKITGIVLSESENVTLVCTILGQINMGLEQNDLLFTADCLHLINSTLSEKHKLQIFEVLKILRRTKDQKYTCPYMLYKTSEGNESFIDLANYAYTWDRLKSISESRFITKDDVNHVIRSIIITEAFQRVTGKDFEKLFIGLQAHSRGYLVRKKIAQNAGKITEIQARRHACDFQNSKSTTENTMNYYRKHEGKIRKIQAFWRGRTARRAFQYLLRAGKPSFSVVRHFCGILNFSAEDYAKDLKLQQLKKQVVELIKENQNLSLELDNIGLCTENHKTVRPITTEGERMFKNYQHLFYALQTNPNYLSKLLFLLPKCTADKILQDLVKALFNFGSGLREEYFLLKLLETVLREEVRCKYEKLSEVNSSNSLVLKMLMNCTRKRYGPRALKELVGPIIEKILSYEMISTEINPAELYKHYSTKTEKEIEKASDLPRTISDQQALKYEQVRVGWHNNIKLLQSILRECLDHITASRNLIPYGILYMAKVLKGTLTEKFPETPEVPILKVVGNLIYQRFINDVLAVPVLCDSSDNAGLLAENSLSDEQRKSLATIAKFLQCAASDEFGEDSSYLQMHLKPFAIECSEKFTKFFRHCCAIEELDDHFSMNEYTEATLGHKPVIAISLQGICDAHSLLAEYRDQIAPDPTDSLHRLLDDLGYTPTVANLLELIEPSIDVNVDQIEKTEVSLTLSKLEVVENDEADLSRVFIKTKELLVSVIQYLKGETLLEALEAENSTAKKDFSNVQTYTASIVELHRSASLEDCKLQLRTYLSKLELGGWVSRDDGYQSIVTAVADDLRNKGHHRVLCNNERKVLRGAVDQCLANLKSLKI